MAEFPAMPLWTDAYLADTLDLERGQHADYLIMLMLAWRRPDNALPNDMNWLKRALASFYAEGLHGHTFNAKVIPVLHRFFHLADDGKWHQKRLDKERSYLKARSETNRQNALKRISNGSQNEVKSDLLGYQNDSGIVDNQEHNVSDGFAPTPTPTPTPRKQDSSFLTEALSSRDDSAELEKAVNAYNSIANEVGLPTCRVLTDQRKGQLRAKIRLIGGLDVWIEAMNKIPNCHFLLGNNNRGWRASFNFFLQDKSITNLIEGVYNGINGADNTVSHIHSHTLRKESNVSGQTRVLNRRLARRLHEDYEETIREGISRSGCGNGYGGDSGLVRSGVSELLALDDPRKPH